jgi:predicted transcriptional regulator
MVSSMPKMQVYLQDEDLAVLREIAKRTNRTVVALIREAIRQVWLRSAKRGPVGLWEGQPRATSSDHDFQYDQP